MFARTVIRKVPQQVVAARSISKSAVRRGGHGDDAHHPHHMWEELPFNKGTIGAWSVGIVVVGVGAIVFACVHQNKKHGFIKK